MALADGAAGPARRAWIARWPAAVAARTHPAERPTMPPDTFRFRHPVVVRFRDVDVGGHAHHSEALMYFEEARWAYWREVVGRGDLEHVDYVLAEARIRWHERVLWPQTLIVGARVSRLGRKHFEMDYEVLSEKGDRLVSGTTVQVMYDFDLGEAVGLPEELRNVLEAHDGPFA
jgi:acyl-CoA thioester hydrolase